MLPALLEELARAGTLDTIRRVRAARGTPARASCTAPVSRADGAGASDNCKIFALAARQRREQGHGATDLGTPGADVIPGLEDPRDIVVSRLHGMTPFTVDVARPDPAQPRDPHRRGDGRLGQPRRVGHGDVGHGPRLPGGDPPRRSGGRPREYAEAVLDNSLSLIATLVSSEQLLDGGSRVADLAEQPRRPARPSPGPHGPPPRRSAPTRRRR